MLCECLAYACCIRQRLTTADIADLTGGCLLGGPGFAAPAVGLAGLEATRRHGLAGLPVPLGSASPVVLYSSRDVHPLISSTQPLPRRLAAPAGAQGTGRRWRRPGGAAAGGSGSLRAPASLACGSTRPQPGGDAGWRRASPCHQTPLCLPPRPSRQAYVVLLATLLTLLPLENAEGPDAEADERLLRELATARDLDAKIGACCTGSSACGGEFRECASSLHGVHPRKCIASPHTLHTPASRRRLPGGPARCSGQAGLGRAAVAVRARERGRSAGRTASMWPVAWLLRGQAAPWAVWQPACLWLRWRGMASCSSVCYHFSAAHMPPLRLLLCVAERASQLVAAATEAGALAFLQAGVLDSVPMQVGPYGGFSRGWARAVPAAAQLCGGSVRPACLGSCLPLVFLRLPPFTPRSLPTAGRHGPPARAVRLHRQPAADGIPDEPRREVSTRPGCQRSTLSALSGGSSSPCMRYAVQ